MIPTISWMTVNPDNLAEQVCRPTTYFKELADVEVLPNDVEDLDIFGEKAAIFGGSGLFYPDTAEVLRKALNRKNHPMVLWGVGANDHLEHLVKWPQWTKEFDLIGLRDFGNPWDYVPCPSCMSPLFDEARDTAPVHDVVVYEHPLCQIKEIKGRAKMNNKHPAEKYREVLMFLASGKTVVTSSYHGVYWAMLLARKVLCWKPFSSKFYSLEPLHYRVNEQNWYKVHSTMRAPAQVYDYLERCRQHNVLFAQKVFKLLKM